MTKALTHIGSQSLIVEEAIESCNDDVLDEMVHENEDLMLAQKYKLKMSTHAANQLGLQACCAFVAYSLATCVGVSIPLSVSYTHLTLPTICSV